MLERVDRLDEITEDIVRSGIAVAEQAKILLPHGDMNAVVLEVMDGVKRTLRTLEEHVQNLKK